MKSLLVPLWLQCIREIGRIGSYPGTTRDSTTVESRVRDEGLSFLTITLPLYCRDFERSLESGRIDSTAFREFRKTGSIPSFLKGMISRVFDHHGILRQDADPKAIGHIRQLTLMFKKLKADCTPERNAAALRAYCDVERDMSNLRVPTPKLSRFEAVSRVLWRNFEVVDFDSLRPKFGPGVTADRLSHLQRREFSYWYERLEPFFPFYGTGLSIGAIGERSPDLVAEEHEEPVRVILVPKTLKTPRVIAAEPAVMQFCQQSLLDHLDRKLDRYYPSFLSMGDQDRNRTLSYNLACATLDLREASDRCHGALVYLMLSGCPNLRDSVFACRSTKAKLPDGTIVPLQKFASMGSALCFPIESMVFFTIVVLAKLGNRPIRDVPRVLSELEGKCSIFGDDIIVPKDSASSTIDELEAFGLRVNRDKSFYNGKFRETCGSDVYDGVDVTPLYCRYPLVEDDPNAIVSLSSLANKFYQRGMVDTARFIWKRYRRKLPYRAPDERYVGFIFAGKEKMRYNTSLQRREVVTHVAVARSKPVRSDGWSGLSDWFHRSLRSTDTYQMKERRKDMPLKIKSMWTAV